MCWAYGVRFLQIAGTCIVFVREVRVVLLWVVSLVQGYYLRSVGLWKYGYYGFDHGAKRVCGLVVGVVE